MTSWKIILVMLAVLIPGGSLVLLAMATAKALMAGRDRMLRQAVPVVQPVSASRGNG
ncbi:MAG: hypothetical protein QM765_14615 [Myxococcales bacterium]